jgi:hypothetical protein
LCMPPLLMTLSSSPPLSSSAGLERRRNPVPDSTRPTYIPRLLLYHARIPAAPRTPLCPGSIAITSIIVIHPHHHRIIVAPLPPLHPYRPGFHSTPAWRACPLLPPHASGAAYLRVHSAAVLIACCSFVFHSSATSLANGSSGFGADCTTRVPTGRSGADTGAGHATWCLSMAKHAAINMTGWATRAGTHQ